MSVDQRTMWRNARRGMRIDRVSHLAMFVASNGRERESLVEHLREKSK
jgi:hypothetical protein